MLILTRKPGEKIIMDNHIIITVINAHRNFVQLGIQAPKNISIHREEIYWKIQEEKAAISAHESFIKEKEDE